jgi:ribose 5-phosphate isomerase B
MKIHLGCDHAGFEIKEKIKNYLVTKHNEVIDHGALKFEAVDDYPVFCFLAAQAAANDENSLAIVIGGSGNGEQISANKVKGVRAALAWSVETAQLAREHNNANVMGLGARMHSDQEVFEIVDAFVETKFSTDPRHQRRIDQIKDFEITGDIPKLPN